jgi:hypothetical protein
MAPATSCTDTSRVLLLILLVGVILLGLPGGSPGASEGGEPLSAAQVFERSATAYRQVPALVDRLTLAVEIPDLEPAASTYRYGLGAGSDAFVEIQDVIRVVTKGDRLYVERLDLPGRYVDVPFGGDFGATLAEARGKLGLGGLWEPPHVALRAGRSLERVVDSFRLTRLIEPLEIARCSALPDSTYEIQLEGENASCSVRFGAAFFIERVDYVVHPPKSPAGYELRLHGEYAPRPLTSAEGLVHFDPGARLAVASVRELEPPRAEVATPAAEVISAQVLESRLLTPNELAASLGERRILLLGEVHRFNETLAYLTDLMERLDDRPISLLLEMHADSQDLIDLYLEDGDEGVLDELFRPGRNLPYQHILRWARGNRERLRCVLAMDESRTEIMCKRVFLSDTRNQTMAEAIAGQYEGDPDVRVIAYGGQLHMGMAGRYRFDNPSREPVGSRLVRMGIARSDLASVMLSGNDRFHLHEVWTRPGALPIADALPTIPIAYLNDGAIYGVTHAGELFDYFVNLGPMTRVEGR